MQENLEFLPIIKDFFSKVDDIKWEYSQPNISAWVQYIKQRIANNQNFLCLVCGQTGSGKSYASLRLGELIDEQFGIDRCVFKAKDFMQLIHEGNLPSGSVIVYDEAGAGSMDSRMWWQTSNRIINYILQVFRHKNLIVFFTVPYMEFIDKNARNLCHAIFETQRIDRANHISFIKPLLIIKTNRQDRPFYKYLRVKSKHYVLKIGEVGVKPPSVKLRHIYEKKKLDFAEELYEDSMLQFGNDGKKIEPSTLKKLTRNEADAYELRKKGMKLKDIAKKMEVSLSYASALLSNAYKKGMPHLKI